MQTYIDELDLGKWPSIYPDNSPTGGGAQPRPGEEVSYASSAQLWSRTEDYTALPWVNNSSGNLQNCAKWNATASKYEWKVNPDDEDDTDFSRGLSFQPYLLWLTKKICEALGYAYNFSLWEQSDYRHLLLMNTTPYANSNLARLNERLDEPFVTVNTVTGDKGIKTCASRMQTSSLDLLRRRQVYPTRRRTSTSAS